MKRPKTSQAKTKDDKHMYDRKFKLIALDIDGTLITGQNTLTKRTKKALRDDYG